MFKVFYVAPDGRVNGAVARLGVSTRQEAEVIAERYRKAHGGKHQYAVYYTDDNGRIARDPDQD
jgi:hypothetical protein